MVNERSNKHPHGRRKSDDLLRSLVRGLIAALLVLVAIIAVGSIGVVKTATTAKDAADEAGEAADRADRLARKVQDNAATIKDLCEVARRQRRTLTQSLENSGAFFNSPLAEESPGLVEFVKKITLPQLRYRVEHEPPPPACVRPIVDHRSP